MNVKEVDITIPELMRYKFNIDLHLYASGKINQMPQRWAQIDFLAWQAQRYLYNAPQGVKQVVFMKYGIPDAPWVETGTYIGATTSFLAKNFPKVYTIEPEPALYRNACTKFEGTSVELFNGTSEEIMPNLLPRLNGSVNIWLDGHYSNPMTYEGESHCPIREELAAIKDNLSHMDKVSILIDDIRCFLSTNPQYKDYPSVDYLVDWARELDLKWTIQQDIFIAFNHTLNTQE